MRRALPIAILAAITLAAFWKFLLLGHTLFDTRLLEAHLGRTAEKPGGWFRSWRPAPGRGDTTFIHPINLKVYNEGLKAGELRLWNPYLLCGTPIHGDTMAHPFYPPHVALHAALPPRVAYDLTLVLHFFFSGVAMYAALRAFRRSRAASLAGALLWMLCGYNSLWFSTEILAGASVFAPLTLLACVRGLESRRLAAAAAAGLAMGMTILGSHPQYALLAFIFFLAWLGAEILRDREGRRFALRFTGVFILLSLGVGGAAILTRLESVAHGFRAAGEDFDRLYGNPVELATYTLGLFMGKVYAPIDPLLRCEFTAYVGLGGLALAATGAARGFSDPRVRFMALFGVFACLAAFAKPLAAALQSVPLLGMSAPSRWLFLVGLCAAPLAARGFDELASRPGRVPVVMAVVAGLFALACLPGIGRFRFANGAVLETLIGFALAVAAAFSIARWRRAALALGFAALLFELLPDFLVFNAHDDPAVLSQTPDAVRFVNAREADPWRGTGMLRDGAGAAPPPNGWILSVGNNLLALAGVEAAAGYQAISPAWLVLFLRTAGGVDMGSGRVLAITKFGSPLLDAANLKYVFTPYDLELPERYRQAGVLGPLRVYENTSALPRAFVVGRALPARNAEEALARVRSPEFDPRQSVVVEGPVSRAMAGGTVRHRVAWKERSPDRLRLRVELESDGMLVVSDTDYPGWEATVDGREEPILRANLAFRAVALNAGRHEVEFRFRPSSARRGIMCSGVSALLALAMLVAARRRSRVDVRIASPEAKG